MSKFKSILFAILSGLFVILFPVMSGTIATIGKITAPQVYYLQGAFMCIPLLVLVIYMIVKKKSFIGLGKINSIYDLLWFIPCLFIFVPVAIRGFEGKDFVSTLGLVFLYLSVGITEELYYRVLNRYFLDKSFKLVYAILASTLIFGLGHMSAFLSSGDVIETLLTVINALIFGLMAVLLFYITNTIYPLMIIHFIFDFETKFTLINGQELMVAEIIRGTMMSVYCIYLIVYLVRKEKNLDIEPISL